MFHFGSVIIYRCHIRSLIQRYIGLAIIYVFRPMAIKEQLREGRFSVGKCNLAPLTVSIFRAANLLFLAVGILVTNKNYLMNLCCV